MKCFVTDLLRQVVVSSTVGFFMVFRVGSLVDKVLFDKVIVSNYDHRCAVGILGILSIFYITKCVGLEVILFAIDLDVTSSFKVFNIFILYFYFIFCISIYCIVNLNQ